MQATPASGTPAGPDSPEVFPQEASDLRSSLLRGLAGRELAVPTLVPPAPSPESAPVVDSPDNGIEDFIRLQRRLLLSTAVISLVAALAAALLFDRTTALSLSLGAVSGMLYLRLLARSVGRIGAESKQVGKAQLLVPVLLVLGCSRVPQLEVLPALIGFLLYKPALLLQAFVRP
ncbi:ATP synthase subunit I [Synechococcus sp. EJ6-Ellesmere]|uniref:ATP synthase subunit I n=1 Tax=Synechococcus sp. EJ6-Ellesmere TaxID=2823734 RepID=UPI0020CF56C2|nr:ATP synthase subunit I [Synechococcus sp. EJ6-Ellesmere]MCP9825006.1 ATP synthase subunit I [Synechococcus sp. EJ6-Ellesmere]